MTKTKIMKLDSWFKRRIQETKNERTDSLRVEKKKNKKKRDNPENETEFGKPY